MFDILVYGSKYGDVGRLGLILAVIIIANVISVGF